MRTVRLIHWKGSEAEERIERLRKVGYRVAYDDVDGAAHARAIAENPPAAVVIDLGRLPSRGRELALFLRRRKASRGIPIVFVDGDEDKVARIRELLPDAAHGSWTGIAGALKRAFAGSASAPVVPASSMAGYSGTPLPRKLGIKESSTVALAGAPHGFESTLGPLPAGVEVKRRLRGRYHRVLWFVRRVADLQRDVRRMERAMAVGGGLWIAWPKKASGVATDLTENEVRRVGLGAGLVDYKVCAIDGTWSGLLFARRRP